MFREHFSKFYHCDQYIGGNSTEKLLKDWEATVMKMLKVFLWCLCWDSMFPWWCQDGGSNTTYFHGQIHLQFSVLDCFKHQRKMREVDSWGETWSGIQHSPFTIHLIIKYSRYITLAYCIALRTVSFKLKKRFPSLDHLVHTGIMRPDELAVFYQLENKV